MSAMASMQARAVDAVLLAFYAAVVVFLFAPIVCALVYAFNLGVVGKQTSTFTGWTMQWFAAAWTDPSLGRAVRASLLVSLWVAAISVPVGSALGFALVRHPVPQVRRLLAALTYALLIVPESVIGVSLLLFYAVTGVPLGMATLVAGITPVTIAVVALVLRARVLTLDRRIEDAAADLGSPRAKTLLFVVLPQLAPAIAAGAVMAYTFGFDNLVISAFLTTPQVNTLPVYLYGSLQYGPAPTVYAAAALVFVVTLLMLGLAALLFRATGRRARARHAL